MKQGPLGCSYIQNLGGVFVFLGPVPQGGGAQGKQAHATGM